ncbi:energy-coupling factor transporter ATP-binding protein EcfA2 [Clostridium algifaecis]|uniref:Energy-coupling factor transporter ATP-binding protein EcfA2 n=1 Tax=Clostridium algifaecis TaxID=1472040 RepID=A0ABS4KVF5_9CLOT|nr:hypothetical protein [Clostridium algifaecis]MBP2033381.1 energy-coupling factor transporter ATP-binding protein EcfA2 [Clostridium algifaecis]
MDKINVNLEYCFGIEKMDYLFNFTDDNVIAIYARNGLMKTSFSKTLKKIQDDQRNLIKDEIFGLDGIANVTKDGAEIQKDDIFVIKSFENSYESDSITSLLVNDEIKNKISKVLKLKEKLIKSLEKYSGLKMVKTVGGKKVYELEPIIIKDFNFSENSFLLNIKKLANETMEYECSNIKYSSIFDDTVIKKITSREFQDKIDDFILKSEEIYSEYEFLEKGKFTLPKLKDIGKALDKDKFFVKDNHMFLGDNLEIRNSEDLNIKIGEIEEKIKATPVFQEIEKMLSDSKGIILKDIIESTPDIVTFLKVNKLDELKKCLWLSYISAEKSKFDELVAEYKSLEQEIDTVDLDDTPWKRALNIFEERFTVPYKMKISNMKGAIIGESVPRVEFAFKRNDKIVEMDRDYLEKIDVLSQGEKRALYLLNIIFDIERIRDEGNEKLIIVDDIADSFDYKNKYAIVEYLYDMAKEDKFHLIILSHNFDFFRTVSGRLNIKRENRLCAEMVNNKIELKQEKYQKQPFEHWKKHLNKRNILALIPFARNIIEYSEDRNIGGLCGIDKDYILLTHLLHEKNFTDIITFDVLKKVYKEYLGVDGFDETIKLTSSVCPEIYIIADSISKSEVDLENKIILAVAIRHKAEIYMINEINNYTGNINWREGKTTKTGTVEAFMHHISLSRNQTRELFSGFKQFGDSDKVKVLEEVNIITPENIHLNSFMYEPILDMDILELINLYNEVKTL